jgi:hypothetical protein
MVIGQPGFGGQLGFDYPEFLLGSNLKQQVDV